MATLKTQLNGESVVLEVGPATVLTGMKRTVLRSRAQAEVDDLFSDDSRDSVAGTALIYVGVFAYPDCLAATVSAEGLDLDMSLTEFASLPEAFVDAWVLAVYQENPHWQPGSAATEEEAAEIKKD